MADIFAKHQQSIASIQTWMKRNVSPDADSPTIKFKWNGNEYACFYSLTQGLYPDQGGSVPMDVLVIIVMEPMPEPGPRVQDDLVFPGDSAIGFPGLDIDQKTWRIQTIDKATSNNMKLTCYDRARGS
jgi:hypothetical protein